MNPSSTPVRKPNPESLKPARSQKLDELVQTLSTEIATQIMEHRADIELIIIDIHRPSADGSTPARTITHAERMK